MRSGGGASGGAAKTDKNIAPFHSHTHLNLENLSNETYVSSIFIASGEGERPDSKLALECETTTTMCMVHLFEIR